MKKQYNVAILGCGAIFDRHLSAISVNSDYFRLIGFFDINKNLSNKYKNDFNDAKVYENEAELFADKDTNCVVILTPGSLHYEQARSALLSGKHVILEKPATFYTHEIVKLENLAKKMNLNIFTVLQVRLNPAVIIAKNSIEQGLLGKIRGVSLIQRWQRPINYFAGWRGKLETSGGILRECAIHYLDILQYLVGMPKAVLYSTSFSTKFIKEELDDTIYALFNFGNYGGIMEVSIGAEPRNLECSLAIMSENGFLKLGGKSLDEIIIADFLDNSINAQFKDIKNTILSMETATIADTGASPYHSQLYREIIFNPDKFTLWQTYNVIELIERISFVNESKYF